MSFENGWNEIELKNIANFSQGVQIGVGKQSNDYKNGYVRFIRIVDFTKNDKDDIRYVKNPGKKYIVNETDVIMIRYGSKTAGKVVRGFNGVIANNLFKINIEEKLLSKDFLYYYLSQEKIYNYFQSIQSSSTMPAITFEMISRLKVPIIPIEEQESIVNILSTLDKKIELNNQIIKTIQDMAQAIYKYYFIDFGPCQDEGFIQSELGQIPREFEIMNIGDAIETLGGSTPKTKIDKYWDGDIIWFTPSDITSNSSMFITESSRKITEEGFENSYTKIFPPYSVMMTSRATVGEVAINRLPACTNQGFITLLPNDDFSLYQLYFWIKQNKELILSRANGSTYKEISKTNFRSLPILKLKNKMKYKNYIDTSKSLFDKIEQLTLENQLLINLKDTILPILMSGEIRVPIEE